LLQHCADVLHGAPFGKQLAATAGVGALIDMITGNANAAGAYFKTRSRRDTAGDFAAGSTR
jgi:hypothetical protein